MESNYVLCVDDLNDLLFVLNRGLVECCLYCLLAVSQANSTLSHVSEKENITSPLSIETVLTDLGEFDTGS